MIKVCQIAQFPRQQFLYDQDGSHLLQTSNRKRNNSDRRRWQLPHCFQPGSTLHRRKNLSIYSSSSRTTIHAIKIKISVNIPVLLHQEQSRRSRSYNSGHTRLYQHRLNNSTQNAIQSLPAQLTLSHFHPSAVLLTHSSLDLQHLERCQTWKVGQELDVATTKELGIDPGARACQYLVEELQWAARMA